MLLAIVLIISIAVGIVSVKWFVHNISMLSMIQGTLNEMLKVNRQCQTELSQLLKKLDDRSADSNK